MSSLCVKKTLAVLVFGLIASFVQAETTSTVSDSGIDIGGNFSGNESVDLSDISTTPSVTETVRSSGLLLRSLEAFVGTLLIGAIA